MKQAISLFLLIACGILSNAQTLTPGSSAPDFKLKSTDNKEVSFSSFPDAKGYIVVFTCNDCPYAKAYEQRIISLNKKYAPLGWPVIAINPNDPAVVPGESFDKMQALAMQKHYGFPYLFDNGQTVTDAYGAKATPHIFIVEKTAAGNMIRYTGAIDNDTEDTNSDRTNYAEDVINALMTGKQPAYTVTKAIGCSVKRKAKVGS